MDATTIRLRSYYARVQNVVDFALATEQFSIPDYIVGTERIDFYPERLQGIDNLSVYDYLTAPEFSSYEEALYDRVTSAAMSNLLVLIGGLGSGKTTAAQYLEYLISARATEISKAYPCTCQSCHRRPIRIDCKDIERQTPLPVAVGEVLHRIRLDLYERLVADWLRQNRVDPAEILRHDRHYRVLRRLVIANDLFEWAEGERLGTYPVALHRADCRLPTTLLSSGVTRQDVLTLIARFREAAEKLESQIRKVILDLPVSIDFAALVLGFYLSRCRADSPLNLIIVDNLDQLLTGTIDDLLMRLHTLCTRNRGARILVPLRPSSLGYQGFISDVQYMYHYGPNCFALMLRRVEEHILGRSRDEISSRLAAKGGRTPSGEELDVFLIATYIYGLVLRAGLDGGQKSFRPPVVHSSHEFLHGMRVSPTGLRNASQTLGALIGTCARYGLNQVKRYFWKAYSDPLVIDTALRRGIRFGATARVPVPYNFLISTILGDWSNPTGEGRVVNLYRAPSSSRNLDQPSLTKFRILVHLRHAERIRVEAVLERLAGFGVPARRGIEALNTLHEKAHLLVWFSTNENLGSGEADLAQDVVISEHGIRYLSSVVADFEYIWFCAQQIPPTVLGLPDHNFRHRLREYKRILAAVGELEWKQIAFWYCSTDGPPVTSRSATQDLLTLWLLYSSLGRAISGAHGALAVATESSEYRGDVTEVVKETALLVLRWQKRYHTAFGGAGYLTHYNPQITRARAALEALGQSGQIEQGVTDVLHEVLESWRPRGDVMTIDERRDLYPVPPAGAFLESILDLSRGSAEFLASWGDRLLNVTDARTNLWHLFRRRRRLADYLEQRLPVYTEVQRRMRGIAKQSEDAARMLVGVGNTQLWELEWLMREAEYFKEKSEQLESYRYSTGKMVSENEMDRMKFCCNQQMELYAGIGEYLGIVETSHLDLHWY
jgi:hypothetical protein